MTLTPDRKLRIPIQLIGDVWEFQLGGPVPATEGAKADLVVSRKFITDSDFLQRLEAESKHKILDEGARFLININTRPDFPPPASLRHLLIPPELVDIGSSSATPKRYPSAFVEVRIGGPDEKQTRLFDTNDGGLWLLTKGFEAIGLGSTTINLPNGIEPHVVSSINHAYTRISEIFEPWRISHTGNIYNQVLYQEENHKWYPLEFLRNDTLHGTEHAIAQQHWIAFVSNMTKNSAL